MVGTHLDLARKLGNVNTDQLRSQVIDKFGHVFSLEENIITVDTLSAGSNDIKTLKNLLNQRKQQMIEVL